MDPAILERLIPIIAIVVPIAMPVAIVWTVKFFKLKHRELDLEAELHGKQMELRLQSLAAPQAAIESALTAIGKKPADPVASPVEQRMSLLEGPATGSEESAEAKTSDPLRVRSR